MRGFTALAIVALPLHAALGSLGLGQGSANANANANGRASGRAKNQGSSGTPSPQAVVRAASIWKADTATVSCFLSDAPTMKRREVRQRASVALAAENDELSHKAVLDRMFLDGSPSSSSSSAGAGANAKVRQANRVLDTQGTFQAVVDGLQDMAQRGDAMSRRSRAAAVQAINQNRCTNVLPAIDTYLAAAGHASQSSSALRARHPENCSPAASAAGGRGRSGNVPGSSRGRSGRA